ncbi:MAG: hypothetical protein WCH98_15345 [Verrucomicrobiota bacterium]
MHADFSAGRKPKADSFRSFQDARRIFLIGLLAILSSPLGMAAPANDNFSAAQTLGPSLPAGATGNNSGATLETDESALGGCSVWYSWTAPSSGWVAVDTFSASGFAQLDTAVAIFSGSSFGSLAVVSCNDEAWGSSFASKLVFYAVGGTTYRIAVSGYNDGTSVAQGEFSLHVSSVTPEARVTGISVSPTALDVSTASKTVEVTAMIESDADLFSIGAPSFLVRSPDGWTALAAVPVVAADRISGDSRAGTYRKTVTVPQGSQPGAWVPSLQIDGASGTNVWSPGGNGAFQDHWVINGRTQLLAVNAPVLTAFSLSPTSAAPYEKVTVNLSVTSGGAGFQRADIWLANGGAWLAGVTSANLVAGDASNGQYQVSFDVPSNLDPGTYQFEVWLEDAAAIRNGYYGTSAGDILAANALVVKPLTLAGWQQKYFGLSPTGGIADNTADPDNDGIANLLEFATNHDPTTPDSGVSSLTMTGNLLTLRYTRALAAVAEGVQFFAEWSDSPGGPWITSSQTVTGSDSSVEQVQASVSIVSVPRRFMRLRVYFPTAL